MYNNYPPEFLKANQADLRKKILGSSTIYFSLASDISKNPKKEGFNLHRKEYTFFRAGHSIKKKNYNSQQQGFLMCLYPCCKFIKRSSVVPRKAHVWPLMICCNSLMVLQGGGVTGKHQGAFFKMLTVSKDRETCISAAVLQSLWDILRLILCVGATHLMLGSQHTLGDFSCLHTSEIIQHLS